MFFSSSIYAQSIECEILRKKIIEEAQNPNLEADIARDKAYRENANSPYAGILAQSAYSSAKAAKDLRIALGQELSLEQKIQIYKQKCE